MAKIVFKELTSNQNVLFPVSLSEKIAPNHPVRIVTYSKQCRRRLGY